MTKTSVVGKRSSMRVCVVYTGGLTPDKGGGIASVINNIIRYTCDRIEYSLLTTYDETEMAKIRKIYPSGIEFNYVKLGHNVLTDTARYFVKEVGDFDILHFHDLPFGREFLLVMKNYVLGKNLLYSHHISYEALSHNRMLLGYYYSAFNWLGATWKKVVANSQFIINNDLSRFRNLQGKVCLIRNGVDVELIRKTKPVNLEGDPSILFVGHLVQRKGIDVLLEAMRLLSSHRIQASPKLHIVGSGEMEENCKEYVIRHGLKNKVHFWGALQESSKFRIMKGADVIVIPSRYENAPIVLLEAIAAGKPIIATSVGGIPEIFEQGAKGILTSPSSHQIARAIVYLCERTTLIEEYGENNQKVAALFDWKNVAESYVKLYESVATMHTS
jgi:glycosyltransferase involved in cell wall biosynthesis